MLISIVIRTLNEEVYLNELLEMVQAQTKLDFEIEVVLVDSGSTDRTISIAELHDCKITRIKKNEFTFGRSLNIGCEFANGDILVFISGHCVPVNKNWLTELISPIREAQAAYVYGRQIGRDTTKYSEHRLFSKYFPEYSKIPQKDFFCNNANSAIGREYWEQLKFNEELTGLEDMYLAKQLFERGERIGYVSTASVYHIHHESWAQTKRRYERESLALQKIHPEIHIHFSDCLRYYFSAVFQDLGCAIQERMFFKELFGIFSFRLSQYWGTYRGNREHRRISSKMKEQYFYPKNMETK